VQLNVINALTRFKVLKNDQYRLPIPTLYRPGRGTHMFGGVDFQQPTDTGAHRSSFPTSSPSSAKRLPSLAPPLLHPVEPPVASPSRSPGTNLLPLAELLLIHRAPLGAELVPVKLPCSLPIKLPKGSS
jgi:hypothetical protein